ncbi:MAG: LuxR C-terminal-related transcriptional regulator [Bacteriovorax sp.]|jgi:DNA-binding CsgD family transcriptional regulator
MTIVSENKIKIITFLILVGTSFLALADIVIDMQKGIGLNHLIHEAFLWLFSMIGAFYQFRIIKWQSNKMLGFKQQIAELDKINEALKFEQKTFEKKISHLSNEFLNYIDEQFNKWGFSRGEKEIALLLIKGLSMKEIADIRGSNENTVRQQASQIYKKSSLSGRMELSAFFLDDLLALSKLP